MKTYTVTITKCYPDEWDGNGRKAEIVKEEDKDDFAFYPLMVNYNLSGPRYYRAEVFNTFEEALERAEQWIG